MPERMPLDELALRMLIATWGRGQPSRESPHPVTTLWRQVNDNLDAYATLRPSETAVVVVGYLRG
jgi:hypothetical protein